MSLKFECPHCTCRLSAGSELYSQEIRCPECFGVLLVPRPEEIGVHTAGAESVQFLCPHCNRKLSARTHQFGKEMPCPHGDCDRPVLVPNPEWRSVSNAILETGNVNVAELIAQAERLNRKAADR